MEGNTMKINAAKITLFLFFAGRCAFAQNPRALAQVANGAFSDGSFRTTFVLFNNNDTAAIVRFNLTDDAGNPMTVVIPGLGTSSSFSLTLDPGAIRIYQTDGSGPLTVGAAGVHSTSPIGVSGIFTIFDTQGRFITESGVGSSQILADFVVPVDSSGDFNTGLALFNPNSDQVSLTAILFDTSGNEMARASKILDGHAHTAFFVAGPGQLFPDLNSFQGTLEIQSPLMISALAIRQNLSPLSYISFQVVSKSSSQTSLRFAQIADGTFSAGSFRTSFLIFSLSSSPANVVLTLTEDNGTPFPVTIPGQGTNSIYNLSVPPGGSMFLQTSGNQLLTVGAATITSDTPIGAAAVFTVLDSQGNFWTEAGVGDSDLSTEMTLPVDIAQNFDTGVAFFNPGASPITATLRLLNSSGVNVGSNQITLEPKSHTARFVTELFPGTFDFLGTVAIAATGPVSAVTLLQNSNPLTYTTLPIAPGVVQGITPGALLSQEEVLPAK
jgi:hypothetical protein